MPSLSLLREGKPVADNTKKDRTSAALEKLQRAEEGRKNMSRYEADAAAVRAKTERLRALRLAKEAAEPAVVAPVKKVAKVAKAAKPAKAPKKPAGTLSAWMKAEKASGRNS
jgi:hypothetical protein